MYSKILHIIEIWKAVKKFEQGYAKKHSRLVDDMQTIREICGLPAFSLLLLKVAFPIPS